MAAPSFRLKIALLSTGLSGLVLLVFELFFLTVVHRVGMARVDSEMLVIGGSLLRLDPFHRHGELSSDLERSLRFVYGPESRQRFVLQVWNRAGRKNYQSPGWPAVLDTVWLPPPRVRDPKPPWRQGPEGGPLPPDAQGPPPPPPEPSSFSFRTARDGNTSWRVALLLHPGGRVLLGRDLSAFEVESARYRNAFLLATPLALLLLAGAGSWVAARALRPVEAVTTTARRITARDLGERVPSVRADREIAELIGVVNGMLERLERSFQQAARFSADAAHELKTPLTILQGQLEQSLQEAPDGSPLQRTLSDLLEETQRLRSIVRKLLLLAQADAGRLGEAGAFEPIDWSERVRELVEDTRELAPGLTVSADVAPGVTVRGDEDLLVQLLQNLAGNAIKFNREGPDGAPGAIDFELRAEESRAVLRIANTGPPLTAEERERIFERFYRGDPSHSRRVDGVGLGLSLAREIALAHGGELKVDTERPGWVRFTLELGVLLL